MILTSDWLWCAAWVCCRLGGWIALNAIVWLVGFGGLPQACLLLLLLELSCLGGGSRCRSWRQELLLPPRQTEGCHGRE